MYIVIETFPIENCHVVTNENGETKIFDSVIDAHNEADDLQNGRVIRIIPE